MELNFSTEIDFVFKVYEREQELANNANITMPPSCEPLITETSHTVFYLNTGDVCATENVACGSLCGLMVDVFLPKVDLATGLITEEDAQTQVLTWGVPLPTGMFQCMHDLHPHCGHDGNSISLGQLVAVGHSMFGDTPSLCHDCESFPEELKAVR